MYLLTSLHLISLFIGFIVLQIYKMSWQEAKIMADILTKIEKRLKTNAPTFLYYVNEFPAKGGVNLQTTVIHKTIKSNTNVILY